MTTENYLNIVNKIDLTKYNISKDLFNKTGFFNISELTPNQKTLDVDCLNKKITDAIPPSKIYILLIGDSKIILDGHHTVISKKLKGLKKIKALYYKHSCTPY